MPAKKRRNPFYILLIPVGVLFVVTACAYGVMMFQVANPVPTAAGASSATVSHPLLQWMRIHGNAALLWELAVLAALTFAAIATDRIWDPRADRA
jgi:flagellar basal body-associated protein FliL